MPVLTAIIFMAIKFYKAVVTVNEKILLWGTLITGHFINGL